MELEKEKEKETLENEITEEDKITQLEEEKRKQRLFEIEKKLGRHNNEKELQNRKNNMVYILALPILLMLGFYLLLKKYLFKTDQPLVLIIFLIIGAISGYWSLIKQVNNIK